MSESNINSQLDATITNFIDNYKQPNMFWATVSPILRSTGLWYKAPTMLPAGFIPQSSAPEDGRNWRPKHVGLIVIINKICYCCIWLAVYIIVSTMHGPTNIKLMSVCFGGD